MLSFLFLATVSHIFSWECFLTPDIIVVQITAGQNDKGLKLYDPGYLNTAPVRSSICYIDGDAGILRYRGYPIEELAEGSSFLEVAYLLSKCFSWNLYSFKCLITGSYAIAGPDSSLKPLYFLVIAIGGIWCLEWFLNGFCNLLKLFVTVAFWLSNNWARFKKIVIVVKVSLSFNDKWEKVWIFAQDYGVWIEIRSDPHIMSELDRLKESAWGRWLWQFQTFWELLKE